MPLMLGKRTLLTSSIQLIVAEAGGPWDVKWTPPNGSFSYSLRHATPPERHSSCPLLRDARGTRLLASYERTGVRSRRFNTYYPGRLACILRAVLTAPSATNRGRLSRSLTQECDLNSTVKSLPSRYHCSVWTPFPCIYLSSAYDDLPCKPRLMGKIRKKQGVHSKRSSRVSCICQANVPVFKSFSCSRPKWAVCMHPA